MERHQQYPTFSAQYYEYQQQHQQYQQYWEAHHQYQQHQPFHQTGHVRNQKQHQQQAVGQQAGTPQGRTTGTPPNAFKMKGSPSKKPKKVKGRDLKPDLKPDLHWLHVPEEHLRAHPLYRPLLHPPVAPFGSYLDLSLFRQSSWQWGQMHVGRLTTSRVHTDTRTHARMYTYTQQPSRFPKSTT